MACGGTVDREAPGTDSHQWIWTIWTIWTWWTWRRVYMETRVTLPAQRQHSVGSPGDSTFPRQDLLYIFIVILHPSIWLTLSIEIDRNRTGTKNDNINDTSATTVKVLPLMFYLRTDTSPHLGYGGRTLKCDQSSDEKKIFGRCFQTRMNGFGLMEN